MVPAQEKQISHSVYSSRSCGFFTSALMAGVQMGEMSRLGWLLGWSSRDMWVDSLYFLYVVLGSICQTFASLQHTSILWPSSYVCWVNLHFSSKSCVRLYLSSTSATIIWDAIHTLLRLLGVPHWSSPDRCPTECTFSLENGSGIETVRGASDIGEIKTFYT
jgi:hypothetical protein